MKSTEFLTWIISVHLSMKVYLTVCRPARGKVLVNKLGFLGLYWSENI